ncbi:hypothetical protein EHN07_00770 [Buttiauxella warmboldiae]|uniref:Uncharacterized protein n=1 Tax=Buttiauxella warmboldiae TaxID=82993 RepID=A0A3N5DZ32_9ENTR|nr:hypothetical protein EHN07_00770 [Buttiauxella warmboldiae]
MPPGRSIRPQFTKLLTILKQQTANELSFASDNLEQHHEITRKKPTEGSAFWLTSPGGEYRPAYC